MYRVNIDKLVNVDSDKKKDFEHIAEDITGNLNLHKSVAVIGGRVDTFRIAYGIMEKGNKVLFIDDFLANGNAAKGIIDLVEQAGAELVGMGFLIEKSFQHGGDFLRERGVHVESLAIIDSLDDCRIVIRD